MYGPVSNIALRLGLPTGKLPQKSAYYFHSFPLQYYSSLVVNFVSYALSAALCARLPWISGKILSLRRWKQEGMENFACFLNSKMIMFPTGTYRRNTTAELLHSLGIRWGLQKYMSYFRLKPHINSLLSQPGGSVFTTCLSVSKILLKGRMSFCRMLFILTWIKFHNWDLTFPSLEHLLLVFTQMKTNQKWDFDYGL